MFALNKATIIGNIGSDVEVKQTNNNISVVSFRVATNESYKNDDGGYTEKTEWHNVVAWRKVADILGEKASKGMKIYIEGKLQTRSYDKDGTKHYMTEIVVSDFILLDKKEMVTNGKQQVEEDLPF